MTTVIVFSHLRWDHVYQRPQQIMTRLGKHFDILFVEEPQQNAGTARLERTSPTPNITVLRPLTPIDACGFHDDQLTLLKPLLTEYLCANGIEDYIVWFYTPQALPLIAQLHPRVVIYDCMDELSGFKNAPRQIVQREHALLKIADIVLTGGPSLYDVKRRLHDNVHCLPSAVDANHFSPENLDFDGELAQFANKLTAHILGPRLGFCGVIDERFDLGLLETMANKKPDWQFVMVGPVVKIPSEELPRAANIHWLGMQNYDVLPYLMAIWDVCLMPFLLNETTRFISPTKTLEYLAAEKPVVSTAIADVIGLYGDVVAIAHTVEQFIEHCDAAISRPRGAREAHIAEVLGMVLRFSWDNSVEVVRKLISEELEKASAAGLALREMGGLVPTDAADESSSLRRTPKDMALKRVRHLIVGAGPTGLSAAYHLGGRGSSGSTLLIEREADVGGKYRPIERDGFRFEYAVPTWSTKDPSVRSIYDKILHDNQQTLDCAPWFYGHNAYIRYPFSGALHNLPASVIKECLVGALEARLDAAAGATGLDVSTAKPGFPADYETFARRVWGAGIAKHFVVPYAEKRWTVAANTLNAPASSERVEGSENLQEIISGALDVSPAQYPVDMITKFPARGGVQSLIDGLLPLLNCEVALKTALLHLSPATQTVRLDDGRTVRFDTLINTMPLSLLIQACGMEAPEEIRTAAASLRYVSIRCVNLAVAHKTPSEMDGKHWINFPEGPIFHRAFIPGNLNPDANRAGRTVLTCEIAYSANRPLLMEGDQLAKRVEMDCRTTGLLATDDQVEAINQIDIPYAYLIPDPACAENIRVIREWLAQFNIVAAGQHGEWDPDATDHPFLAGKRAAEEAVATAYQMYDEGFSKRASSEAGTQAPSTISRRIAS